MQCIDTVSKRTEYMQGESLAPFRDFENLDKLNTFLRIRKFLQHVHCSTSHTESHLEL